MLSAKSLTLLACITCLFSNPAWSNETEHQRVIKLKGTQNTRDIGGYEAADGRRLRWGKIYRSGSLSRLTREDFQSLEVYLGQLGVDQAMRESLSRLLTE